MENIDCNNNPDIAASQQVEECKNGDDPRMDKGVISTHTFIYPFTYGDDDSGSKKLKQYIDDNKECWTKNEGNNISFMGPEDRYMTGQYFNKEAGKLFHLWPKEHDDDGNEDNTACDIYSYNQDIVDKLTYYIMHRHYDYDKKENVCHKYRLRVHRITLFLFDKHDNAGILSIETYYRPDDQDDKARAKTFNEQLEDIKRINDYGRRVSLPFIIRGENPKIDLMCADEIGLIYKGSKDWVTNYRKMMEKWQDKELADFFRPPDFILGLIYGCISEQSKGECKIESGDFPKIDYVIDDRMYLLCLIKNEYISKIAKKVDCLLDSEAEYDMTLKERNKKQEVLYSVEYADHYDPTCQNNVMREELLRKSTYTRWSDYGTIYSVTGNAFICMTSNNDNIKEKVYRPFLTEYYLMTVLVLAQKLSISVFADKAAKNATGAEKNGLLPSKQVNEIIGMHETFVSWYNQVYLLEATEQEQGIEVYDLLRKQFGVYTHMKSLKQQMADLYAVANVNQGSRLSGIAATFAILAVVIDVTLNLQNFMGPVIESIGIKWIQMVLNGLVCLATFGLLFWVFKMGIIATKKLDISKFKLIGKKFPSVWRINMDKWINKLIIYAGKERSQKCKRLDGQ